MPLTVLNRRKGSSSKSGHAAGFTAAQHQYMSLPSQTALTLPAGGGVPDICITGWLWLNSSSGGFQKIIAKDGGSTATDEWGIQINPTAGPGSTQTLEAYTSNTAQYFIADWNATLLAQTWYYFSVRFKQAPSGEILISVNNASQIVAAAGVHAGTNPVIFGGDNIGSSWLDGRLDAVVIFSGTITLTDQANLYNSGLGVRYKTRPSSLSVSPFAWYDMEDGGQLWSDSTGDGNTLTAFNGVSLVQGKT